MDCSTPGPAFWDLLPQELLELSKNEAFEALKLGSVAGAAGNGRVEAPEGVGKGLVPNKDSQQEREFIK